MIKHTPLVRKITYLLGFTSIALGVLSIAGILIYQYWFLPSGARCEKWKSEVIAPQTIQGKILDVRESGTSSDCQILLTVEGFGDLLWCTCIPIDENQTLYPPQTGDYLSKDANSLLVTLCSSDSTCATFDFPCCD